MADQWICKDLSCDALKYLIMILQVSVGSWAAMAAICLHYGHLWYHTTQRIHTIWVLHPILQQPDIPGASYARTHVSTITTPLMFWGTSVIFQNWMLILVLLCKNERQRWDGSRSIKACSEAQCFYVYRDASHLWRSFSHNRTKINIQNL